MTSSSNTQISPVACIEALYDRLTRARTLIADNKVHPVYGMADHYIVEGKKAKYLVNGSCICLDSVNRPELKGLCKHKLAALVYAEQEVKAQTPQGSEATTAKAESDRSLEDQLEDFVPKSQADQLAEVEARLEAIFHTGIVRPRWAVGLTNQEVAAVAEYEGQNPYRPDWFDGLDPVVICEAKSGCFRHGTRETITDLKQQRARLRMELAEVGPTR